MVWRLVFLCLCLLGPAAVQASGPGQGQTITATKAVNYRAEILGWLRYTMPCCDIRIGRITQPYPSGYRQGGMWEEVHIWYSMETRGCGWLDIHGVYYFAPLPAQLRTNRKYEGIYFRGDWERYTSPEYWGEPRLTGS